MQARDLGKRRARRRGAGILTRKQRDIVVLLVILNLVVYGAFLYFFSSAPSPARPAPGTAVAFQPPLTVVWVIAAGDTPSPTATPSRTETFTLVPTAPTINSATSPAPFAIHTLAPTFPPQPTRTPRPATATPNLRVSSAPVSAPPVSGGENASNALTPRDIWQTLGAGASVWYKVGNGGDHIEAYLEANPLSGMGMEIFAPDNLSRPIGQGTYQNSSGRLVWAGGKWNSSGDWMARVTNYNSAAVLYKLTTVTRDIERCDTESYWEYIGPNLVYWTRCK